MSFCFYLLPEENEICTSVSDSISLWRIFIYFQIAFYHSGICILVRPYNYPVFVCTQEKSYSEAQLNATLKIKNKNNHSL